MGVRQKMISVKRKRSIDVDMTEGAILKHLIVFAFPLLIGNLFQMLYNMVDTLVVGQFVSDEAFAAVGSLGPVTNLMIGFFMGFSSGAGVLVSKYFGAHDIENVKKTVSTTVVMTAVVAVLFTGLGLLLVEPFLNILDMPSDVEAEARTYLTIWYAGIAGLMIYNVGSALMRAVGDSRRPFIMLVVCAIVNTLLDLVFVLVFGMGVEGVALATIIAQGISALLVVILLFTTESAVKIEKKYFKYDWKIQKTIIKIGVPTALRMAITSFSNIFVQSYINGFGKAGMGGWSAYNKIDMVVLLPMQSLSLAATTFVGQNVGLGQIKRAEKGANVALAASLVATGALIVPIIIFPGFFVSIFNSNPDIIEYGALFLRLLTPFYLVWCINMVYAGALQGTGNTLVPMIIMLSSFVAFRQVYLYVMANFISDSPVAIALSFPLGWLLSSVITLIYYKKKGLAPKQKEQQVTA